MSRHTLFSSATLALLLSVSFLSAVDAADPSSSRGNPPPPPGPGPKLSFTPPAATGGADRGGLFGQIGAGGFKLKKVADEDKNDRSAARPDANPSGGQAPAPRADANRGPAPGGKSGGTPAPGIPAPFALPGMTGAPKLRSTGINLTGGSAAPRPSAPPTTGPKPKADGATCPPGRVLTEKVTVSGKKFTRPSASAPILAPVPAEAPGSPAVRPSTSEAQLSAAEVQRELDTWRDTHTASQSRLFNEFLEHFRHPETAERDEQEDMNYLRGSLDATTDSAIGRLAIKLNDGHGDRNENVRALSRFFGNLLGELKPTERKRENIRNLLTLLRQDLEHPHVAAPRPSAAKLVAAAPPPSFAAPSAPRIVGGHELPAIATKPKAKSAPQEVVHETKKGGALAGLLAASATQEKKGQVEVTAAAPSAKRGSALSGLLAASATQKGTATSPVPPAATPSAKKGGTLAGLLAASSKNTGAPPPPGPMPQAKAPPPPPGAMPPPASRPQGAPGLLDQITGKPKLRNVSDANKRDRSGVSGTKEQPKTATHSANDMVGALNALAATMAQRRAGVGESRQNDGSSASGWSSDEQ